MSVVKLEITKLGKVLIGLSIISLSYFVLNLKYDKSEKIVETKIIKIIDKVEKKEFSKPIMVNNTQKVIKDLYVENIIKEQAVSKKVPPIQKIISKEKVILTKESKIDAPQKVISKLKKKPVLISCKKEIKQGKSSKVCTIKNIYAERDNIVKISWLNTDTNKIEREVERVLERYTNSIYDYRFIPGRESNNYDVIFKIEDKVYTETINMN
jgi:hypothetical protein